MYGPIPDGLHVLHRCDNRICINPDHLFLGTALDNMADMKAKQRARRGDRHPMSKLTDDKVREIRRLYTQGDVSQKALGQAFGVRAGTIGDIVRRERWAWLPDEPEP